MPSFIAELEAVPSVNLGEHVAPVIAVLDVVALRKSDSPSHPELADTHDRYGKVAGLVEVSFDSVVTKAGFVQHRRREGVSFVYLDRRPIVCIRGVECRPNRGATLADSVADEVAINSVVGEVLVQSDIPLLGVVVAG